MGKNKHEAQTENISNTVKKIITRNNKSYQSQVIDSQVELHTIDKSNVTKVRSEAESVMTMIRTRMQEAKFTAIENFVTPRVELAMKSAKAASGQDVDTFIPDPDRLISRKNWRSSDELSKFEQSLDWNRCDSW